MAGVIWMSSQNCTGAVELLGEDQAGEGVGQGEGSERQEKLGAAPGLVAPAVGRADGKHDLLRTLVTALPNPRGEGLGSHLAAAAVEQNGKRGCSALFAVEPGKQVLLRPEALSPAWQERRAALHIGRGKRGKAVLWWEPRRRDMGQDQFQKQLPFDQERPRI
jgi:GNAT superfamily N-acetyltransferase